MANYLEHLYSMILVVFTLCATVDGNMCPEDWYRDPMTPSYCFYYIPTPATYSDAEKSCHRVGGALVAPVTYFETSGVMSVIQVEVPEDLRRNVWVDMHLEEDRSWVSTNDTKLNSIDWYDGYPEGDGDCGVLFYSLGELKNKLCSHKSAFICRAHADKADSTGSSCAPLGNSMKRDTTSVPVGTYHYLICEPGYFLSSHGHRKTYCTKNGTWSKTPDELAICQVESCVEIGVGRDVKETTKNSSTEVGAMRSFTCEQGYTFKTQRNTPDIVVECKPDGTWMSKDGQLHTSIKDCMLVTVDDVEDDGGESSVSTLRLSTALQVIVMATLLLSPLGIYV